MPDIHETIEISDEKIADDNDQATNDADKVFSHAHSDGQEFSGTLKQAREICPVLGRMSVENAQATLQEGDLAARVKQRGREKRQAEIDKTHESKKNSSEPSTSRKLDSLDDVVIKEPEQADKHRIAVLDKLPTVNTLYDSLVKQEVPDITASVSMETHEKPVSKAVYEEAPHDTLAKETELVHQSTEVVQVIPIHRVLEEEQIFEATIVTSDTPEATLQIITSEPNLNPPSLAEAAESAVLEHMKYLKPIITDINENDEIITLEQAVADVDLAKVVEFTIPEFKAVVPVQELLIPIEKIETTIAELTEWLDSSESDETTNVDHILEEIISLPSEFVEATGETEEVLTQKLEELIIELFEETGIEYTPELVEYFIKFTQSHYFVELLETFNEGKIKQLSDEIGTREYLQKLRHRSTNMKQTIVSFCKIGKSVLLSSGLTNIT